MTRGQTRPARRVRLGLEQLEDRLVPALLGNQLYPSDHAWNQRIDDAPVAANSNAIIGNLLSEYGNGRIHPDFTQNFGTNTGLLGIPYNIVHGNSTPKVQVVIDAYAAESDHQLVPIPANAVIENDFQDGPRFGLANRDDSHLLIYDVDNQIAYELYHASRPDENGDGLWHADQQTVWDMTSNAFRAIGHTSADAAGLSLLAGLTRPDEALPVDQGGQGVINHAIRVTFASDIIREQFLYPASHTANPGNDQDYQIPMGGRLRLREDIDISHLYPQSRIIAQAMKDYGLIVADNGGNFFFSGASSSVNADNQTVLTWDDADIQDWDHGLMSLVFSDFQVVDLTPRVDSIDVHEGDAGTVVTITGQNFSGAAGQLRVLFGNNPATSVTVLDDSHVQAVAPSGVGPVDVRVQSGIDYTSPLNYTGDVFGYGRSEVNPNAVFTFPTPVNAAPTLAASAAALPAVLTGYSTTLNVMGADDGGESNLTYTWNVIAKPSAAADPLLQRNGSNAAKSTMIGFFLTGSYTLRVTITDVEGLSVTSDVAVTVVPVFSFIIMTPTTTKIQINRSVRFIAFGLDQYGYVLAQQPKFTWRLKGLGRITTTGRYYAPSTKGGPYTITVRAGNFLASAKVTVVTSLPRRAMASS